MTDSTTIRPMVTIHDTRTWALLPCFILILHCAGTRRRDRMPPLIYEGRHGPDRGLPGRIVTAKSVSVAGLLTVIRRVSQVTRGAAGGARMGGARNAGGSVIARPCGRMPVARRAKRPSGSRGRTQGADPSLSSPQTGPSSILW